MQKVLCQYFYYICIFGPVKMVNHKQRAEEKEEEEEEKEEKKITVSSPTQAKLGRGEK